MENCEEQRKILDLPSFVFPAAMVVFGYPTGQQVQRRKPERADMKYVVFEDSYHELSGKELEKMLSISALTSKVVMEAKDILFYLLN